MTRPAFLRAESKQSLALCIRRVPFWTPTITACWLSVALCTVCMPMLFALCLLSGVWHLVRSLTPNMVFTQAVTLCNPCSFFGTYNMLHEQLNPIGHPGCTLLSLVLIKPMTPFQGRHYGNTLGVLASLRLCCLWLKTCTTVMSMSWRMVIRLLACIRLVGYNKITRLPPVTPVFFP